MANDDGNHFIVTDNQHGMRLDIVIAGYLPDCSRTQIQKWIINGHVTVDGVIVNRPKETASIGAHIIVQRPTIKLSGLTPINIPLNVAFEDEAIIIINKPAGMVVHPAVGHDTDTLVHALLYHCGDSLLGIGDEQRPGIVHRLDKDTSGLMVVAKTQGAHQHLTNQFHDRTIKRTYHAVCWGHLSKPFGTISTQMGRCPNNRQKMAVVASGGKIAITHYRVIKPLRQMTLLECQLDTGRTHQIRVHLHHLKYPIVGDPVYGGNRTADIKRQALHASQLSLIHPISQEIMHFSCELPTDLVGLIEGES